MYLKADFDHEPVGFPIGTGGAATGTVCLDNLQVRSGTTAVAPASWGLLKVDYRE